MRTDESRHRASAQSRLRDGAKRAWRWANDRGPRARLILAGAALAVLVAAGYFLSVAPATTETDWLYKEHALSPRDAERALAALAVAKIPAKAGPRGQIAVAVDRRGDALAILKKENLVPRSLRDLQDAAEATSPFDWHVDRGEKSLRLLQDELQLLISELGGVASADVLITRPTGRATGPRPPKVSVFVCVKPEEGQALLPQSLRAIQALLRSTVPDLAPDAITVMDKAGRTYLEAGNPEAGAVTMARAREEEIAAKIKDKLDWISGLRVFVTLEAPPVVPPTPAAPAVVVNGAAEVPEPATQVAPSAPGKATILVQVPISDYYRRYQAMHHRQGSLDDLRPFVAKTENTIRSTIHFVVPAAEIANLQIDRIDDSGSLPPAAPVEAEAVRFREWWVPAGIAAGVSVVLMLTMGTRWLATRRPAPAVSAVPRAHFEVNDDAGPSGRVRELVRRDPAAAAGVLHRWIGQGGHAS